MNTTARAEDPAHPRGAAPMTVFAFDHATAKSKLDADGWVHQPEGLTVPFLQALRAQTQAFLADSGGDLDDWRFPDKKAQFLWQLPEGLALEDLLAEVAAVTGMDPTKITLAERHVKVYSPDSDDFPPPHKDRGASTFTLGFAVEVPPASRLALWPTTDPRFNYFPTSADWRNSRPFGELPENIVRGIPPIELDMRPGDFVAFRGAEIYHERYRPAGTVVLYLKFNDHCLDPLGEDPRTMAAEVATALALADQGLAMSGSVALSPRVVGLRTDEFFPGGRLHMQVRLVDGATAVALSEAEVGLVRRLANRGPIEMAKLEAEEVASVRALAEQKIVVFR